MDISLIVAADKNLGIGKYNQLPWKLKTEMKFFRNKTEAKNASYTNIVIMGRNTWESIPQQFRPLRNRVNIVLTSRPVNSNLYQDTFFVNSLENAFRVCQSYSTQKMVSQIFIIGGQKLYQEILSNPETDLYNLDKIYQTEIYKDFECDTFL